MDMEFVQFYPLGFCFPDSLRGALGGLCYYLHLLNNRGERFLQRYEPERLELTTRDRVARAMVTEIREGRGGPHGGVFGDMTYHEPGYIQRMQPALCETYSKFGVNPEKEYVELAPTCHFFMGGVKVDENWLSTVPGLFMVGESGAGIQGANRLSQNALAELLVSGHRSGKAAARHARAAEPARMNPKEADAAVAAAGQMLTREKGIRPVALRNRLRRLMWEKVGVFRDAKGLEAARQELAEIKNDLEHQALDMTTRHYNQELVEGLENRFLVATGECVIAGALQRTESRGAHFREDFPESDHKNWLQHLVLHRDDNRLRIEKIPVDLREIRPGEERE
jgi:succinate dehydrogenase/fumarate reductase flavoprotein subunit